MKPAIQSIRYASGYKYQLRESYSVQTAMIGFPTAVDSFITLTPDGRLIIGAGYAWDGPSGPTIDTRNFMRGSLVHDAFYQLMRKGFLPESCRAIADRELRKICREDGMSWVRAWWVYQGVRIGGHDSAKRQKELVLVAP